MTAYRTDRIILLSTIILGFLKLLCIFAKNRRAMQTQIFYPNNEPVVSSFERSGEEGYLSVDKIPVSHRASLLKASLSADEFKDEMSKRLNDYFEKKNISCK
jgi:hypothetical protein